MELLTITTLVSRIRSAHLSVNVEILSSHIHITNVLSVIIGIMILVNSLVSSLSFLLSFHVEKDHTLSFACHPLPPLTNTPPTSVCNIAARATVAGRCNGPITKPCPCFGREDAGWKDHVGPRNASYSFRNPLSLFRFHLCIERAKGYPYASSICTSTSPRSLNGQLHPRLSRLITVFSFSYATQPVIVSYVVCREYFCLWDWCLLELINFGGVSKCFSCNPPSIRLSLLLSI
jgi:hypothetical protein